MHRPTVESAIREIIKAVGEDPDREGLRGTPGRVARAYEEMLAGYTLDPKKILATTFAEGHSEMVIERDIPFYSLCEHHMLPFFGVVHIGYIPQGRLVGISKFVRLVECYSRRLQIQERMTSQIADALTAELNPIGVGVVTIAEHLCMTARGVRVSGAKTITSAMRGLLFHEEKARAEFLHLTK